MAGTVDYIAFEKEYVEARLAEIKEYLDSNPFNEITDRILVLQGAKGPVEKVVSSIEVQQKAYTTTLKEYMSLMEAASKLREREAAQIKARGNAHISTLAKGFINQEK